MTQTGVRFEVRVSDLGVFSSRRYAGNVPHLYHVILPGRKNISKNFYLFALDCLIGVGEN